jgi:hypothetical protein
VRGGTFVLVVTGLVLIAILLGLFALWLVSNPSKNEGEQESKISAQEESTVQESTVGEPTGKAQGNVVVRVSGTQGVGYEGTYNTREEIQTVDGTVGTEPTDYDANVEGLEDATLTAVFRKTEPGGGTLKVGILSDDQVIAESATSAEYGEVTVKWPSQNPSEHKGTTLPGEPG